MPYTADVVVAFLVAHGNRLLSLAEPVPYERHAQGFAERVRFWRGDAAALSFEAWAAQGGVERLGIMVPARVYASKPRLHETKESARVLLRELGSNSVLVARRAGVDDVYLLTQPASTYEFRFCASTEPLPLMNDRDGVRARLAAALAAAAAFARQAKLAGWDKKFEAAGQALETTPGAGLAVQQFAGALAPASLSLLDAAWRGDISGGMGSWNDLEPTDGYGQVTSALGDALGDAFEAAINAGIQA